MKFVVFSFLFFVSTALQANHSLSVTINDGGTLRATALNDDAKINQNTKLFLIAGDNLKLTLGSSLLTAETVVVFSALTRNVEIAAIFQSSKRFLAAVWDMNGNGIMDMEDALLGVQLDDPLVYPAEVKQPKQQTSDSISSFNFYTNADLGAYIQGRPRGENYCYITSVGPFYDPIAGSQQMLCTRTKAD